MTDLAAYVLPWLVAIIFICADEARRNRAIDACMRRHPAFTDDTETAIEQALAVGDDGAALVGEVEDYLRRRTR